MEGDQIGTWLAGGPVSKSKTIRNYFSKILCWKNVFDCLKEYSLSLVWCQISPRRTPGQIGDWFAVHEE